jgi:hypothetical protein
MRDGGHGSKTHAARRNAAMIFDAVRFATRNGLP